MAEMNNLTVLASFEMMGAEEFEKTVERVISTFEALNNTLKDLNDRLREINSEKITLLGLDFDVLADKSGALKELNNQIKNFKQALVSGNEDAIRFAADFFNDLAITIDWLNEHFPGLTQLVTIFTLVGAAVGVLAIGLAGLAATLGALKISLVAFLGAIGVITFIVAGISAGIITLVQNWDGLVMAAEITWEEDIIPRLEQVAEAITSGIEAIRELALTIWEGLKEATSAAWEYIRDFVAGSVSSVLTVFNQMIGQISQAWESVKQAASAVWEAIVGFITDRILSLQEFFSGIPEAMTGVWSAVQEAATNAWEYIKETVSSAIDTIKGFFGGIGESLSGVWNGAIDKAVEIWEGIKGVVSGAVESIKGFGEEIKNSLINAFTGAFEQVKETFSNLLGGLKERWDNFIKFFGSDEQPAIPPVPPPTPTPGPGPVITPAPTPNPAKDQTAQLNGIIDLTKNYGDLGNQIAITTEKTKDFTIANYTNEELLKDAQASLGGYTLGQGYMSDAVGGTTQSMIALAKKGLEPLAGGTKETNNAVLDLTSSFEAGAVVFGYMKEDLAGVSSAAENTGASVEQLGDTLEQVESSGGFFDGIKQGFIDFVENVESNSELMADFFANTLSQMSQSFSDLFFNVLTGRFDNLQDLAKQAFEAILRAFLDMVSAIATRQIVISVAGVLGFSTGKSTAQDVIQSAQSAKTVVDAAGNSFPATESGDFAPTELDPDTALPAEGSGIGAGIGAGLLGIGIGSAIGGIINSDMTGWQQGISFGLGAAGAVTGFLIGGPVGAAIGGLVGSLIVPIISGLLKKTPRLDIDFDSVKTELGRRAALVEEFLDPEFFMENIGQVSVKRGGVGIGAGGSNQILELIRERIQETIEGIQDIIAKLPTDLFNQLNETLLGAEIDIDTVIAGERLLEFDAKGKKIGEKFQQFIEGELPAKFFAAIRESFFEPAFLALGVSAEGTEALIDKFMADMEAAGSREARAEVGAEFIATFNAFVDAFNIVSGNVNDSIGQTIQSVNNLSAKLGFDAVPSIDELRKTLGEMIENAEIDAETVQAYADLRNAIVSLMSEITSAITGLIGKINQLNTTIVSLGGSAVDTTGFLNTAATQIQDFLGANMGNLSLSEQEGFLDQLLGVANDMLAQEQAAFEQAQQAAEAQRAAVQQRIDGLNAEKERIEETFNARIEALNEELRIAEGFARLTESIRRTLDSILYSPESVLTGVEQVNALQSNVAALQQELAGTTDPERQMEIVGQLEEAFKTLFGAAGDAFGVNSPEYVAIFDQVTGGLSGLADMTESRARTVEEINAEIERLTAEQNSRLESIDAKIEAAQEQLSAIGTQEVEATFQASDRVKELFEYIRTEYMRILEERFAQLEEASVTGFATELEGLTAIGATLEDSFVTLKEQMAEAVTQTGLLTRIADTLAGLSGYDGGSGGLTDFGRGTLAVLHGKEAVVTEAQVNALKTHMALAAEMTGGLGGALGGALETFAESIEGAGPVTRLGSELTGAGRLTELADRLGTARIKSMMEEFAGANAGGGAAGGLVERLAEKLSAEDGHISGLARRAAVEEVKNEMSVAISVNVNGGSGATMAGIGNEIENMLVRSIKQGGRLRSAIQDAGAKRMG